MREKIIILGHNSLSRLSVARALGRVGYYVIVVAPKQNYQLYKSLDTYSKYINEYHNCVYQDNELLNFLIHSFHDSTHKIVLFPTSDYTVSFISLYENILKNSFVFPHLNENEGSTIGWMDKLKQKELAEEVGLNVAKGWLVNISNGEFTRTNEIQFPCFVKPLRSIKGGKKWLKRCDTNEELSTFLHQISSYEKNIQLLVEEFISITHEYAIVGYAYGNGALLPGFISIEELAGAGHFGVAKTGRILPPTSISGIQDLFSKYIRRIGYNGMFDIDFYECNGIFFFGELNLRYGGSSEAYIRMGINLPAIMVEHLSQGILPKKEPSITTSASFVNELTSLDDWYYNISSFEEYQRIIKKADFGFIKDEEDLKPYSIGFKNLIREKKFKKIIKKFFLWGKY